MTAGSRVVRSLSALLLLPLILNRFTTEEIAVFLLFRSIISLRILGDMGFSDTFARFIAYGMAGEEHLGDYRVLRPPIRNRAPNWPTIAAICGTMEYIFRRLAPAAFVVLGGGLTWAMVRPISTLAHPTSGWIAWSVVVLSLAIVFRGNTYLAYLIGVNQIALLRRWEIITSLGGLVTAVVTILLGGHLLEIILALQIWEVVNVIRNWWLCRRVEDRHFAAFDLHSLDRGILHEAWQRAWRSGLGVLFSMGLVEATGILYAQIGSTDTLATYLLALRIIQMLAQIAQAPFYSKLPLLARFRAAGDREQLTAVAQRGMRLSHWWFVLGFGSAAIFGPPVLVLIRSNAVFPPPLLWLLLGLAFFAQRFGSMHLQLYSTTNHIIWHTVNGLSAVILVAVSGALLFVLDVLAFPIGMLAGYAGFYAWFCALRSYRSVDVSFWAFERTTMLPPLAGLLLFTTTWMMLV